MIVTAANQGVSETEITAGKRYTGQVIYLYAFDLASELDPAPVERLLGQPVRPFLVDTGKRSPRYQPLFQPRMAHLPTVSDESPLGPVTMHCSLKLFPVGAISLMVRVPFAVDSLEDLVAYHDLEFRGRMLHEHARQVAEQAWSELRACCKSPVSSLAEEEAYTVFCLTPPLTSPEGVAVGAEPWFMQHRREIAALLTQEPNTEHLSRQEAEESTSRYLSYYQQDLVVVDWDAALVVDSPDNIEQTVYVMELANLHLAELEAYDQILDDACERAYRELSHRTWRTREQGLRLLREIRIDLTRFNDAMSNITKFFGDWHLARLYQHIAARFHLSDWRHTVDEKLQTVDDLYQILNHDRTNRWMLLLEGTIVLLFIIDLLVLFLGARH